MLFVSKELFNLKQNYILKNRFLGYKISKQAL
ncbi:MAG: hypothetical protein ACI9XO_003139, partial [Paraglaciecola sp.]